MIFLFGSPGHTNLGDQAQTYCIVDFCKKNYPEYGILIFTLHRFNTYICTLLQFVIRKQDLIFFHSGYHMTDLYNEQSVYLRLVEKFPHKKIVVFPQTISYKNEDNLKKTAAVLNKSGNVLLLCRDEVSYATAIKHFVNCTLLLYPDIVTSLIGKKQYKNNRNGILFCLRNDIERFYSEEQIETLRQRFSNTVCETTDTTLHDMTGKEVIRHRQEILENTWEKYSRFQLVITDRYHGTIFSLIAGTPVIVLSSSDHKLSSGVKWFPKEIFGDYVAYARNLDEAYSKAHEMILKSHDGILPTYFLDNYYSKLKSHIGL